MLIATCLSTSRAAVQLFTAIPRALERFIDKGYVRQDVAHSAVIAGTRSQRGPLAMNLYKVATATSEAGKKRLVLCAFQSTCPAEADKRLLPAFSLLRVGRCAERAERGKDANHKGRRITRSKTN